MSDDWLDDPFSADDPAAAERERRRREREERRRQRREKADGGESAAPAPPPDLAPPPRPPRQEFWEEEDEEPAAATPQATTAPARSSPPAPPSGRGEPRRRRRRILVAAALAVLLVGAAVAAAAYRYLDDEEPPPVVLKTITLTVPEGYSRAQTAELTEGAGMRGDYLAASVRSPYLSPVRYGGEDAEDLEGYLFPDTFELKRRAPVGDLVQLQLEDFKRRVANLDMSYARSKNLTMHDVVTIASMVEEEAQLDSERRLIAAVIYNRLREGIPLGIDATVRFATGNYVDPLTESDLGVDSPYNTRANTGLPPGPISSPGLASIEAAARPAQTDHLYYVVEPGTCGKHAFSSSDVEFQADVARYNEAREEAGGESPDSCEE
jgi:cell division protein YceG involved in septum cleavage